MRVLLVIVLLIAYGSLFPGNFFTPSTGGLEEFLANRYLFTSKGDVLGNIALFFPLRVASMIFVSGKLGTTIPIVWLFLLVLIFAFILQVSRSGYLPDWQRWRMFFGI